MDAWDLAQLDTAEGKAILWRLAVRMPPGCGTVCSIGLYYLLVAELKPINDASY